MTRRITVRSGSVPRKVVPPASAAAVAGVDTDAIHDNVDGEIVLVTEKVSPVGADVLLIEDSEASDAKKRVQITNLPGGGGASPLTTKGDLFGYDTDDQRIPIGTDGHVLKADSGETLGVTWAAGAGGTDSDAIHDNVDGEISAIAAKGSPDDADFLLIEDAAASNAKKRITIGDLPAGGGGINTLYETNLATGAVASTSAYAAKGNLVRPRENLKIHALTYFGTILSGATYRAYVITYSGTTVTAVIGAGDLVVAGANDVGTTSGSSSPTIRLPFPTPISLTADTQYLIAVGRTDGGDTYVLPVQYPTALGGYSFSKFLPKGSGRIAKQAPAGGDTISIFSTGVARIGVEYEWV